jgi:hypothetical protein
VHEVIRITVGDLDQEAVMSKRECEVVSITGDHNRISLGSSQPVPFGLALDEIKHRIVQAYMRLVFRADNARGSRTVSVTRSSLLEVQMTELPPEILAPGMPLFLLEVFLLPSHAPVDNYGFFDLDDTELVAAAEFVLGTARETESMIASALH